MTSDTLLATLNAKELLALLEGESVSSGGSYGPVRDYTKPQLKRFRD